MLLQERTPVRNRPPGSSSLLKQVRVLLMTGEFRWLEKYRKGAISLVLRNPEKAQPSGMTQSQELVLPWVPHQQAFR